MRLRNNNSLRGLAAIGCLIVLALSLGQTASRADDLDQPCTVPDGTSAFGFQSEGNQLRGFIDEPSGRNHLPAILLLQGSGPTDVVHDDQTDAGYYRAIREVFRSAGLATVEWDKAGNGCSKGHYAHGTPIMARATEVVAAIEALKQRPEIDPKRIGLWGISQGGWVAPMVAVRSADVAFLILVSSPGGDAVSELHYQAVNALSASGLGSVELHSASVTLGRALAIMRAGGSQLEFAAALEPVQKYAALRELGITVGTPEGYRAWQSGTEFVYRPESALEQLTQPTLAIFGDRDALVDWRESVAVYQTAFKRANNPDLTIKVFKGADHNLYRVEPHQEHRFIHDYFDQMIKWLRAKGFAQAA